MTAATDVKAATDVARSGAEGAPTATDVAEPRADQAPTALSEQWLELARTGQATVAGTVAEFVDTVEKVVPVSAGVAKQREIIDAGLAMAQAIARAPYSVVSGLAHSVALVNVDVENVNVEVDTKVGVDVDVASGGSESPREPAG